jgi:two-component system sensor histidine kinase RegB
MRWRPTELVLAREQHLSQLDGLAAAAAHELGTPLATITLIAKELQLAIPPDSEHADDVRLLNEQAKRCRSIPRQAHRALERRSFRPHEALHVDRGGGGAASQFRRGDQRRPVARPSGRAGWRPQPGESCTASEICWRTQVDFARERVEVAASVERAGRRRHHYRRWPGLCPRKSWTESASLTSPAAGSSARASTARPSGLGLGFFIAKTLLERSGATLDFENRAFPDRGAVVRVHWGRSDFERPMAFAS